MDRLHASAAATQSIALMAVVALALVARTDLELGDWFPARAAISFGAVMLLTIGTVRRHHPFAAFGLANQVTTARAVLVVLLASLIGEPGTTTVATSVVAAALVVTLLDGVDGCLARRTRMASAFGARFDLEIDALLIQVLAILAWQYGKAGVWVLLSGLLRYLFVAAGGVWPWMRRPLPSSRRGKTICVVQIVSLIVALVPSVRQPVSGLVAALGLLALCYSFLADTLWLWRVRAA